MTEQVDFKQEPQQSLVEELMNAPKREDVQPSATGAATKKIAEALQVKSILLALAEH